MEIDGVLILGVAISAADAFSPSANAVVTTRTVATKPVVTDAFSITAKPTSVTNDVNLKQLREAFEGMDPREHQQREKAADQVFERAAAVLAAGLAVRMENTRLDDAEEAEALIDDDETMMLGNRRHDIKRVRFS